jgi:hypothetical protein
MPLRHTDSTTRAYRSWKQMSRRWTIPPVSVAVTVTAVEAARRAGAHVAGGVFVVPLTPGLQLRDRHAESASYETCSPVRLSG